MANKVAVVTDSTAYVPEDYVKKYNITVVPLNVIWGEEQILDLVEISAEEFFQRLSTDKLIPTTSQPSPAVFKEVYEKLHGEGYDILSVHISSKLSGTMASAVQAKEMLPDAAIEVVDSYLTAMGLGWPVILAAQAAAEGKDLAACRQIVEQGCQQVYVCFALDTLEFLHRGGRIGGAQRFIGTALNFKPILELNDGAIEALERVRTQKKALAKLVEIAKEKAQDKQPVYLGVFHSQAFAEAKHVLDAIAAEVEIKDSVITDISPVVGVHTGPGTVGFAVLAA